MNKYLITIVLSILSVTSQAEVWIQTEICNKTGRDVTLYKPRSSDTPSYANKSSTDTRPWLMFNGYRTSGYDNYIENVTIPYTNDCFYGTTKITVWDNNWGGSWDYMTLCDFDNYCKYGQYSLQFYNPSSTSNAGVIPGYTYYNGNGDRELCGDVDNNIACPQFTKHANTSCYYKKTINKNDSDEGGYVYNCFVELLF